jgi:hypothetical protein
LGNDVGLVLGGRPAGQQLERVRGRRAGRAGKVFDRTITLDEVPDGYRAMDDRKALKVLVRP